MIEMKYETSQVLYQLKTVFFNHMDLTKGQVLYEDFIKELLLKMKSILAIDEASLYSYNEEKQHFYTEATTLPLKNEVIKLKIESAIIQGKPENGYFFTHQTTQSELDRFDILIPIRDENRLNRILCIREKVPGLLINLGQDGEVLVKECVEIIETAQNLLEMINEKRRYKELFRVTEHFHSSMSMDAVLEKIIETLHKVYPNFSYYLLISHDNDNHGNLPIKDLGYDSENVAAMKAYVTGTIQQEQLEDRGTVLYAPLKGKQGVYGVLQVIAPNTINFPNNEIEFINLLAATAGSALENAQLYQQSKRLIADLQLINETSHKLNSNLRLSETMEFLKQQISKSFHADETGLILLLPDGETGLITGSSDFFHTDASECYVQYLKEKINTDKESLFIGDLSLQLSNEKWEFRSLMAVPIMESNLLKGFAVVLHREPYYFSFDMFKLLQSLIHHSSLALANSMLREELEKMVITDHLTRLHSRNYLDEKIYQSMETDSQGTFILIDIDDFKKVNDTYGHQIGDDILVQLGKLIQANIRDSDVGARWGGEELAIYLPKVSLSVGVTIAQRLLERVRDLSAPRITISCGVSYWSNESIDNAKDLFKRADEALYQAKNTGKNKVLVNDQSFYTSKN